MSQQEAGLQGSGPPESRPEDDTNQTHSSQHRVYKNTRYSYIDTRPAAHPIFSHHAPAAARPAQCDCSCNHIRDHTPAPATLFDSGRRDLDQLSWGCFRVAHHGEPTLTLPFLFVPFLFYYRPLLRLKYLSRFLGLVLSFTASAAVVLYFHPTPKVRVFTRVSQDWLRPVAPPRNPPCKYHTQFAPSRMPITCNYIQPQYICFS